MTREDTLREIARLELRIFELRASLPPVVKKFYVFRCKPESRVLVYAENRQQADQRLRDRMDRNYPASPENPKPWSVTSTVVEETTDPTIAANNAPGNLLQSLTEPEALEFLADWKADRRGRDKQQNGDHQSQIEKDVEHYEAILRLRQSMRVSSPV